MKVLVTGASGRMAGSVIHELADRYELVLASRRKLPEELADFPWIQGDVTSFEDCQRMVKGVEVIQHLGAQSWPSDHPEFWGGCKKHGIPFDATFKTNMLGTYYLMQAAVEAGVRIVVMAGSNCALGHGFRISKTPFPFRALPMDETHPCYPEDSYSYSKYAGEALLASYTRAYGIRTYVTRPTAITPKSVSLQMAKNIGPSEGWCPWLWGWVGSEDCARAHRLLMEAGNELPRHDVYFLNSDDTAALEPSYELVERFKPELLPLAESMTGYQSFITCNKIKRELGWEHKTSWRNLE